ncbi:hypothetical protein VSS37_10520 [Candidatus Thiothrix sp. Deng01]|uniref:Uncharacterized protein n=1 Tax=Candidatus Thiothrix phosphatis TaxID=3112415 RepID=A0ABU6CYE8_9GAMM|nr:hypothetical protein [Candidatus Thiothrix sp. Deng01]MEB4591413.1 hypothetical protein [Candidatus Thiothrix sp. Deng01]
MSDFLDSLNKNSGALSAVFSGVVTVATVIYAWLTWKLVDETRKMRQAQTEPRVQVTYRVREEWVNLLDISVKNIGLGPAYDIRLHIREHNDVSGAQILKEALLKLACFKSGLSYLGPGQEYFSFWTSLAEGDATKVDSRLVIVCSYKSATGISQVDDYVIDLSEMKGSSRLGEPPLHKMAKQLEKIEQHLQHTIGGSRRLRVDSFSQADRDAERAALEERIQRDREGAN